MSKGGGERFPAVVVVVIERHGSTRCGNGQFAAERVTNLWNSGAGFGPELIGLDERVGQIKGVRTRRCLTCR